MCVCACVCVCVCVREREREKNQFRQRLFFTEMCRNIPDHVLYLRYCVLEYQYLLSLIIDTTFAVFKELMMSCSVTSSKQKTERKNRQNWMPKSRSFDKFSMFSECYAFFLYYTFIDMSN